MDRQTYTTPSTSDGVITVYGGDNRVTFRVVQSWSRSGRADRPRSITEMNRWMLKNARAVDGHAKRSTRRMIARDEL